MTVWMSTVSKPVESERRRAAIDAGHVEWLSLPSTISTARTASATHYFTGRPCRNDHVSPRYASSGLCLRCSLPPPRTPDHLLPETRVKAIDAGERYYFDHTECRNGHIAPRNVVGGYCRQCDQEAQARHKATKGRA